MREAVFIEISQPLERCVRKGKPARIFLSLSKATLHLEMVSGVRLANAREYQEVMHLPQLKCLGFLSKEVGGEREPPFSLFLSHIFTPLWTLQMEENSEQELLKLKHDDRRNCMYVVYGMIW